LYLAMTLGPACFVLAWMDRPHGPWSQRLIVFGRVPLLFYVLHIALIHAVAIATLWPALGTAALTYSFPSEGGRGYPLAAGDALSAAGVLVLYPVCRCCGGVTRHSTAAGLSYLGAAPRPLCSPASWRRPPRAPRDTRRRRPMARRRRRCRRPSALPSRRQPT